MLRGMRRRLIDLPIKQKLVVIITATAVAVLFLSSLAFIANEIHSTWRSSLEDLSTTARIVGANSSAALAFDDEEAAAEMLGALEAKPGIEAAFLYNAAGTILTRYDHPREHPGGSPVEFERSPAELLPDGAVERSFAAGNHLHVARAILLGGDRIGTIHIVRDMQGLSASIRSYLAIAAGIVILSGFVAIALATRLQRIVSKPVGYIMETMARVAATRDYSHRAVRYGDDELGSLVDGLNDMLERIERQTADLTEARAQAEAASLAKSRFLANMSHEVRTPLNGVVGMLKLMRSTSLTRQQSRYVDTAIAASDTLLDVINDILDFSKIEAGRLDLERVDFNVRDAVDRVVQLFAEKANEKKLELVSLVYHDVPGKVRGDPNRLIQVLINLVGNAVKFTATGEVVVRCTVASQEERRIVLRFTVTDTGVGMSAEQRSRLFEPFTQGDASTTRRYGGTGLGLAISKQLVSLMGGDIGAEGALGAGSTFWFTVALERRPDDEARDPDLAELDGLRVIVVDDNETSRQVLGEQIASWGCSVTPASGGHDALAHLANAAADGDPFAVAVIDGHMAGMTGAELGGRITTDASLRGTRLILLSALTDGEAESALSAGFHASLTKPVRQSELRAALLSAVNEWPAKEAGSSGAGSRSASPRAARILVAEDNDINQALVLEILAMAGHVGDCVCNGRAAVAAFQNRGYDIVLMDCQMPELDGYEATREIRQWEQARSHSRLHRVPIIAMTAHALAGDREACIEAGMDDYLAKPLDPDRVQDVIESWLGRPRTAAPEAERKHPLPKEASPPDVDFASLVDRCMGNESLAMRLVEKFETQSATNLAEIMETVKAGDVDRTAFLAHRLKGAAANLSADGIAAEAARIEAAARSGSIEAVAEPLAQLERAITRFRSRRRSESPAAT